MDNNQFKAVVCGCITVMVLISLVCISSSYDAKTKADVMIECLKAQKFDCKAK